MECRKIGKLKKRASFHYLVTGFCRSAIFPKMKVNNAIGIIRTLLILVFFQIIFALPLFAQYNFNTFLFNAKTDIGKNNYFDAITKLNKCLAVEPDNCEVYFYRALCKYSLLDNFGAEQDFTMALTSFSAVYYDAYQYRALSRYRLGKYSEAIDDVNKAIEKKLNDPELYGERACFLLACNKYTEAIKDCNKALSLKFIDEDVFLCKAQAEDAIADYQNAICDYDEAIKLNPKNTDNIALRGMTKFKTDSVKAAIDDYNLALEKDSTCTLAYYNRAEAAIKTGDTLNAMSDYNNVLRYEPRNSYAYFSRAVLYANLRKYKLAISDFNKVILLNPNNIEALFNRAKLKQMLEDYKGAIGDYDKLILIYPYFVAAYYYRSQSKYYLKDFEGSKKDVETGKMMSDIFHNKNNMEYNKDSLLLIKLSHLSADFHTVSDIKPDSANNNFLPVFYLTEKDSNNYQTRNFSLLLENFNNNNKQNLCLKNKNSFDNDSTLIRSIQRSDKDSSKQTLLVSAIFKSNMQLLKEARVLLDKIIADDSLNTVALFARGVNTCREIESAAQNTDENHYLVTNPHQEEIDNKRLERCKSALADFTKVLRIKPDFNFALYNRAYIKCLLNDFYGANFDYDQAIKLNPGFADAYYNNGFLLYYLNLKQAACENFSKAGELGIPEAFSIIKKNCKAN